MGCEANTNHTLWMSLFVYVQLFIFNALTPNICSKRKQAGSFVTRDGLTCGCLENSLLGTSWGFLFNAKSDFEFTFFSFLSCAFLDWLLQNHGAQRDIRFLVFPKPTQTKCPLFQKCPTWRAQCLQKWILFLIKKTPIFAKYLTNLHLFHIPLDCVTANMATGRQGIRKI